MKELEGKRILILQQRKWSTTIGHPLAKHLHEQGCRLATITLKRTADLYARNQQDVPYEMIVSNDEIMGNPEKFIGAATPTLAQVCDDLGIDAIWPLANALRLHVRSYRDGYYYSYKQNVSDEGIVEYIRAFHQCIVKVFTEFKPELIITPNFVSMPHIMLNLYAKRRGVKMFGVTDSKIRDISIFTYGYQDDQGPFYDRLDELEKGGAVSQNIGRARTYIAEFRKKFIAPAYHVDADKKVSLYKRIRMELSPYRNIWYWYTKPNQKFNHLDSLGVTPDYRPPRFILRDFYAEKKNKAFMKKFAYFPFGKVGKYVYFPLQVQPEATIDVIAPFHNNQIETARQVAMSLPDDYTLVVKEHPAMIGLRKPSYIERLARTPNVKVIDYRTPNETVIKGADLIVSPNSTTIAEAAFYRKPAIQLGNLGTTLRLPNVIKHADLTTLSKTIKEHMQADLDTEEYDRRLERYVAAVYDTGFDVNYFNTWTYGGDEKTMASLCDIYKKEVADNFREKADA
jgi:hypothetical protein